MTADAVEYAFEPILISAYDVLTVGTAAQIEDHNNLYWCLHAEKRPTGFDPSVCKRR